MSSQIKIIKGDFGEAALLDYPALNNKPAHHETVVLVPSDEKKFGRLHTHMKNRERVHPVEDEDELRHLRLGSGSLHNLWMPGTSDKLGLILLNADIAPERHAIEEALQGDAVPFDAIVYVHLHRIPEMKPGTIDLSTLYGDIPAIRVTPPQPINTDFNTLIPWSLSAERGGRRMIMALYNLLHEEPALINTGTPFKKLDGTPGFKQWLFDSGLAGNDTSEALYKHAVTYVLSGVNSGHNFHRHMGSLAGNIILSPADLDDSAITLVYHPSPHIISQNQKAFQDKKMMMSEHLVQHVPDEYEDNVIPVSKYLPLFALTC